MSASIARRASPRSVVGGSFTEGLPDRATIARLYLAGRLLAKSSDSCLAASIRFGFTSVARIDWLTSITSTIVARSRGTRSTPFGRAHAITIATRLSSVIATARCRRHCDCFGITAPNTAVFV